jgi:hypothetical protein
MKGRMREEEEKRRKKQRSGRVEMTEWTKEQGTNE